ncbi:endoglucanase V-like protein [Armillaria fumosa]|nr:endoglucanase V-like protein [Armillaria fumosa]
MALLLSLLLPALAVSASALDRRAEGGYIQEASGLASFTTYSGCSSPACGQTVTGYTAAMNQLAYGAASGDGAGDACGRCFAVTATADTSNSGYTGPFSTIVVKVTNLCPYTDTEWCGQTTSDPYNSHGLPYHFDICADDGASDVFFPSGHTALSGNFTEVSCDEWSGSDGSKLWDTGCLDGETADFWPAVGCGNVGTCDSFFIIPRSI